MMPADWVEVYSANGQLAAETVRLFLESNGITAELIQESAGVAYGLTVGPLGEVRIFVPLEHEDEAQRLLQAMEDGELETGADLTELESAEDAEDDL
jgi:hypothetical protein